MRFAVLLPAVILLAAAAPAMETPEDAGRHRECPETSDRISPDQLDVLIAEPAALARAGDWEGAQHLFETQLEARRRRGELVAVADSLTAFGVEAFVQAMADPELRSRATPYLRRAVDASAAAFGPEHPEVAVAWHTVADLDLQLNPDEPPLEAIEALERAHDIRFKTLGPSHPETISGLA